MATITSNQVVTVVPHLVEDISDHVVRQTRPSAVSFRTLKTHK
uniref:Uncharacterized protein n=1 Tax=Meloidogyne enterolobii TaxID=390850 RepID=A0A6V7TME3_MELEN|nr:unnamed protein product [Meloidogyne enterolobii]